MRKHVQDIAQRISLLPPGQWNWFSANAGQYLLSIFLRQFGHRFRHAKVPRSFLLNIAYSFPL